MMDMWKWNLAFQCVVNIGVRGSEAVRTRVVEADMVPVIATILDNYIKVVEKCREKAEAEVRRHSGRSGSATPKASSRPTTSQTAQIPHNFRQSFFDRSNGNTDNRQSRRQAPPPSIEIPEPYSSPAGQSSAMDMTPTPQYVVTSPPERTTFNQQSLNQTSDVRRPAGRPQRPHIVQPLATAGPALDMAGGFGLRPVRESDRLPSMLPSLQPGITSQPDSPTTPSAPIANRQLPSNGGRGRRRPSIRHQQSTSGDSDDANGEDSGATEEETSRDNAEPIIGVEEGMTLRGVEGQDTLLDGEEAPLSLMARTASQEQGAETFNVAVRSTLDPTMLNATATPQVNGNVAFLPPQNHLETGNQSPATNVYPRYLLDRAAPPGIITAMPRDEDVLMSLQLLAYVSKYCNLRSYFQQSHLVPKLKIGQDIRLLDDGDHESIMEDDAEEQEEYLLPDDYNIFPLVEKFTVRHHSKDMQYWAGVVMRNLCRKDDSRGGIRQCAHYRCGKWEEYTRQFAKCRRCRRTKYCSKECQKSAWVFHRHWCHAATQ